MLIHIHPDNPQPRLIKQVVEILKKGGVIIYPTDTIYGLGCDIFQHKAIERICAIKKVEPHLGYIHRSIEKMCESLSYRQFIYSTSRMDSQGSASSFSKSLAES